MSWLVNGLAVPNLKQRMYFVIRQPFGINNFSFNIVLCTMVIDLESSKTELCGSRSKAAWTSGKKGEMDG